jgi:hypothetical protein
MVMETVYSDLQPNQKGESNAPASESGRYKGGIEARGRGEPLPYYREKKEGGVKPPLRLIANAGFLWEFGGGPTAAEGFD